MVRIFHEIENIDLQKKVHVEHFFFFFLEFCVSGTFFETRTRYLNFNKTV